MEWTGRSEQQEIIEHGDFYVVLRQASIGSILVKSMGTSGPNTFVWAVFNKRTK
jgi:hypothetical protein